MHQLDAAAAKWRRSDRRRHARRRDSRAGAASVPEPPRALSECSRLEGRAAREIADIPHVGRYQHSGPCWLGFSKRREKYLEGAGFERATITPLPADETAKGPSLFVATARKS